MALAPYPMLAPCSVDHPFDHSFGFAHRFWLAHMLTSGHVTDEQNHSGHVEQYFTKHIKPLMQSDGKTHEEGRGEGWVRVLSPAFRCCFSLLVARHLIVWAVWDCRSTSSIATRRPRWWWTSTSPGQRAWRARRGWRRRRMPSRQRRWPRRTRRLLRLRRATCDTSAHSPCLADSFAFVYFLYHSLAQQAR